MVDWTTMIVTAGAANVGSFIGWFLFRRTIERMDAEKERQDRENNALVARVDILEEKRVAELEREIKAEGAKRKEIYQHLEEIRLEWMSKKDCHDMHAALTVQYENYMAAVLKLEGVSTEVARLVGWVDDVSKEQIGAGKDIAALAAQMRILCERQATPQARKG